MKRLFLLAMLMIGTSIYGAEAGNSEVITLKCRYDYGAVQSVAWSPKGRQLASGVQDKAIQVWDLSDMKPFTIRGNSSSFIAGHYSSVSSVDWSPDGQYIVSGSFDSTIKIWKPHIAYCTNTLEPKATVNSVAWSPDGSQIASGLSSASFSFSPSFSPTTQIWDPEGGSFSSNELWSFSDTKSVAWSPDGSQLALGSNDKTVKVWDPRSGVKDDSRLDKLKDHSGTVYSVTWSPDGFQLASGCEDTDIKIWDLRTLACIKTLEGHSNGVWSVDWSPDGYHIASGSEDNTCRIWDILSGECISTLQDHSDIVYSVAWSPDGSQLASGSQDKTIKIQIKDVILSQHQERVSKEKLEQLAKKLETPPEKIAALLQSSPSPLGGNSNSDVIPIEFVLAANLLGLLRDNSKQNKEFLQTIVSQSVSSQPASASSVATHLPDHVRSRLDRWLEAKTDDIEVMMIKNVAQQERDKHDQAHPKYQIWNKIIQNINDKLIQRFHS